MPWTAATALRDTLSLLLPARRRATRRRRRAIAGAAAPAAGPRRPGLTPGPEGPPARTGSDDRPPCGWFDSSHELSHGLQVTEHAQPETLAQLVPLRWWLAWELDAAAPRTPPIR